MAFWSSDIVLASYKCVDALASRLITLVMDLFGKSTSNGHDGCWRCNAKQLLVFPKGSKKNECSIRARFLERKVEKRVAEICARFLEAEIEKRVAEIGARFLEAKVEKRALRIRARFFGGGRKKTSEVPVA